jgi:hypothetical protein
VLRQARSPDICFHDLRHTAATLMLQQSIHPKVVQERLGHADIALTLNTYSHVLPNIQEEVVQKLDQLFSVKDSGSNAQPVPTPAEGGTIWPKSLHDWPGLLQGCYRKESPRYSMALPMPRRGLH